MNAHVGSSPTPSVLYRGFPHSVFGRMDTKWTQSRAKKEAQGLGIPLGRVASLAVYERPQRPFLRLGYECQEIL